jgi:glycosidase
MGRPAFPALYQINTRVWLTALSRRQGRAATLDDIPDAELDRIATMGFEWVWLLSVWQTGRAGREESLGNPEWREEFRHTLPDLTDADIGGSGFAITGYTVHQDLGGAPALARIRARLRSRGLRLMLDVVPNHTGLDHPWVESHPEYYVAGGELELTRNPGTIAGSGAAAAICSWPHGRDPYFPGWPDTFQLNYGNPATQDAMLAELMPSPGSATASAATWRCWCSPRCSSGPGASAPSPSGPRLPAP